MAAEKSLAIVLRVTEFSETSCIVNLMTRDFGRLTAIAKGARRLKSPFEGAIDVLAMCHVVFIPKSNAMSILTEAKLERRFRSASADLRRLYAGFYIVELLQKLTDEGDPAPELFELARDVLLQIDSEDFSENDLNLRLLRYELALLDLLGQLPMLTRCVSCGREKTEISEVNFGLNAGGVLCHRCRRGKADVVKLSASGFEKLLELVGGQIGVDSANSDNWNRADQVQENRRSVGSWVLAETQQDKTGELDEIRNLIRSYITHLLGFQPRLHSFLKQV